MRIFERVAKAWWGEEPIPGVSAPYSPDDHAQAAMQSGLSARAAQVKRAEFMASEEASRKWRAEMTRELLAHEALRSF